VVRGAFGVEAPACPALLFTFLSLRSWLQRAHELPGLLNVVLGPEPDGAAPDLERLWGIDLAALNPGVERLARHAKLLGCFARGVRLGRHQEMYQTMDIVSSNYSTKRKKSNGNTARG